MWSWMGQLCMPTLLNRLSAMIGVDVDAIRQQSLELDHKLSAAAEELSNLHQEVARAGQARREVLRALERARVEVAQLCSQARLTELRQSFDDAHQTRQEEAQLLVRRVTSRASTQLPAKLTLSVGRPFCVMKGRQLDRKSSTSLLLVRTSVPLLAAKPIRHCWHSSKPRPCELRPSCIRQHYSSQQLHKLSAP